MNGTHARIETDPVDRIVSHLRKWFYAHWWLSIFPPDFADLKEAIDKPVQREMLIFAAEKIKRMPLSREREAVLREIAVELGELQCTP